MAELRDIPTKVLGAGKKVSSKATQLKDRAIAKVGSSPKETTLRVETPKGRAFGRVLYRVKAVADTKTFTKLKDAREYRRLLKASTASVESEIIRTEVTEEGYTVSEEKK